MDTAAPGAASLGTSSQANHEAKVAAKTAQQQEDQDTSSAGPNAASDADRMDADERRDQGQVEDDEEVEDDDWLFSDTDITHLGQGIQRQKQRQMYHSTRYPINAANSERILNDPGSDARSMGQGDIDDSARVLQATPPTFPLKLSTSEDPHSTERPFHAIGMEERDSRKLMATFEDTGYREGITAGKLSTLQEGFDEAFADIGVPLGRRLGSLKGRLDVLRFVTAQMADALGIAQDRGASHQMHRCETQQHQQHLQEQGQQSNATVSVSPLLPAAPKLELSLEDDARPSRWRSRDSSLSTSARKAAVTALDSDLEDAPLAAVRTRWKGVSASPSTSAASSAANSPRHKGRVLPAFDLASAANGPFLSYAALPFISLSSRVPPTASPSAAGGLRDFTLSQLRDACATLDSLSAETRALTLEQIAPPDWEALAHEREHERERESELGGCGGLSAEHTSEVGTGCGEPQGGGTRQGSQEQTRQREDEQARLAPLHAIETRLASAEEAVLAAVRALRGLPAASESAATASANTGIGGTHGDVEPAKSEVTVQARRICA
ncbi:hypothetical protein K437DRAFT_293223 [Tilletiaria anomala UBC 951]|uniref:Protein YAE1 n=1 Tax=Tilletiaria anomala (strain ATCC 24038 / CBS 436.72 / UBC 951) TaxID=1037660 RepID=A0A066WMB5_TILAU|nr:uncharacterized protein K437DRAFT_293223 [Tilletiaria anomala UBC 951]KDN52144.1 hypothetical protein K437DRAFT_293223 [Tilletiaria anomala UBC 951]